ncbi:hypothetical protein D9M70_403180 [compost metagenome]
MAAEALVGDQLGETPLFIGQLLLVAVLVEAERKIEGIEQAAVVQAGHQRRGMRTGSVAAPGLQRGLQAFQEDAPDAQAAEIRVVALDHVPGRELAVGAAQHQFGGLDDLVVDLRLLPVEHADLPLVPGIALQLLLTLLQLLLGEVEPELEDQRALVGEHPLGAHGLLDGLLHLAALQPPLDPADQHLAVPVAEEDADLPFRRQPAPEAPLRRPRQLLVGGQQKARHLDVARIEPLVEQLDRLALARALDAVDQQDHRKARLLLQLQLRLEQRGTQLDDRRLVGFLVDGVADFCRLEHRTLPD